MKIFVIIIPLLVISVSLLVRLEIKKQKKGIYSAKPISTILVIVTCLLSLFDIGASVPFTLSILLGLLFSFGGDMALMFQERATYFRAGLVLFLVAHIVYGGAFVSFAGSVPQFPLIAALFFGLGTAIYLLLLPGLGKMKVSVGVYILIISFMAAAAVSTLYSPGHNAQDGDPRDGGQPPLLYLGRDPCPQSVSVPDEVQSALARTLLRGAVHDRRFHLLFCSEVV